MSRVVGVPFPQGERRDGRLHTDKLLEYKNQREGASASQTTLLFSKTRYRFQLLLDETNV